MDRRVTSFAERAAARRWPSILYVGAELVDHSAVEQVFAELGLAVRWVDGAQAMMAAIEDQDLPLCLLDVSGDGKALRLANLIRGRRPDTLLAGVVDPTRAEATDEARRAGVSDILSWPLTARALTALVDTARERVRTAGGPLLAESVESPSYGLFGRSPAMRQVMELVRNAAVREGGVLICGERGTGREMTARAIHAHSARPEAPFIKIDCAVTSPQELEHGLFGLAQKREGISERRSIERVTPAALLYRARGGTLFLEHITNMPGRVQAKVVRALRDREIRLVDDPGNGARGEVVDLEIRLMAAVEPTFEAGLSEGRIRAELYERLTAIRIDLPQLCDRRGDIPSLAMYFLVALCRDQGTTPRTFTRSALALLSALPWRENAHELRSLLSHLVASVPRHLIRLEDVLAHVRLEGNVAPSGTDVTLRDARTRFEREYITAVLQQQHGRVGEAARVLGIQRTNLYRKIRQLKIAIPRPSSKDL